MYKKSLQYIYTNLHSNFAKKVLINSEQIPNLSKNTINKKTAVQREPNKIKTLQNTFKNNCLLARK